jgi:ATP-dependent DNA helicase RecG
MNTESSHIRLTPPCYSLGSVPPRFLGRPVVDILRYEGTEAKVGRELNVVKREVVEGPLPAIIRDSFAFIRTQIRERSPLTGLTFDSAPEYPELAWQEAIVNAVAHRDYGILGTPIFVRLFDDRMEIESPGTAVPPNDIDGIRAGRYIHCSRNPQVVRVLKDLGFMRGFAEGIRRMSREMQSRDLHPPEFSQPNHAFRVTLYNAPVFSVDTQAWLRQFNGLPLSGAQRRALALLHRFGQISNAQYRQVNQVGREKAVRDLHKLVEMDVLVLSGRGSRAHYTLSDKYAEPLQVPLPLDPRQKVLNYVRQFGSIANRDCRELLQLRRPAARKLLQQLVHQGSLRMVGSRRGTRYVLP